MFFQSEPEHFPHIHPNPHNPHRTIRNRQMTFTPIVSEGLERLRKEVETHLDLYTRWDHACPEPLKEAIRYSLLSNGKLLRPLLCLLACELCGGEAKAAIPGACAVEMIHCYSLIHDDLPCMDDDDLRRGRPTCHIQFDEATAILAGDALHALAFEIMVEHIRPLSLSARCCGALASAVGPLGMVAGQVDDIQASKSQDNIPSGRNAVDWMKSIHNRKTGNMIRVSLKIGAMIAEANESQLETIDRYGIHFGLGFQISDDLLDWTGNEQLVGKRLRKDIEHNKLTYPNLLGVDASRDQAILAMQNAREALEEFSSRKNKETFSPYNALMEYTDYALNREK